MVSPCQSRRTLRATSMMYNTSAVLPHLNFSTRIAEFLACKANMATCSTVLTQHPLLFLQVFQQAARRSTVPDLQSVLQTCKHVGHDDCNATFQPRRDDYNNDE
eukprot:scpid85159/ scgid32733/ 